MVPDLRGYGDSSKPPTDGEHLTYSKRAMALDMVEVMGALGFNRFDVAGHDRRARVTYRLALDHPKCVRRLAVLDIIPMLERGHFIPEELPGPLTDRLLAFFGDATNR